MQFNIFYHLPTKLKRTGDIYDDNWGNQIKSSLKTKKNINANKQMN